MSIDITGYPFEGPFRDASNLKDISGVYVILTHNGTNYTVIDAGESQQVRSRIEGHDRADCWRRNNRNGLWVAAYYCDAASRMRIEKVLRDQFNPICGVR